MQNSTLNTLIQENAGRKSVPFCKIFFAGQKFPSKTLELSLQATVRFPDQYTPAGGVDTDDPFCVGLNTYADVSHLPVFSL